MKIRKKPFALLIYGPTGVGKTDIALSLGEHIPIEIINMDVGQFYTPFSIGTAKPDWKNDTIPHHLFDIIDSPSHMSVIEYRNRIIPLVFDIYNRGALPVLVGGSAFYVYSLFFTYHNNHNLFLPKSAMIQNDVHSNWDELYAIDSARAMNIKKNDTYRIERALEIWRMSNTKPTEFIKKYDPFMNFLLLHITRDRKELYKKIDVRVAEMIKQGWIGEVQQLEKDGWSTFIENKKLIGYNELLHYTKQNDPSLLQKTIELIAQRTRQYAKRQETFGRKLARDIMQYASKTDNVFEMVEVHSMTHVNNVEYVTQLAQRLKGLVR